MMPTKAVMSVTARSNSESIDVDIAAEKLKTHRAEEVRPGDD